MLICYHQNFPIIQSEKFLSRVGLELRLLVLQLTNKIWEEGVWGIIFVMGLKYIFLGFSSTPFCTWQNMENIMEVEFMN